MSYSGAQLENAVIKVAARLVDLRSGQTTKQYDDETLFFELTSCILGSQVSFEMALAVADRLRSSVSYGWLLNTRDERQLTELLTRCLSEPIADSNSPYFGRRYRFWQSRAAWIARASILVNHLHGGLGSFLANERCERDQRRILAERVPGIGPKQASLFLRNIGRAFNLAILDTHVLSYMSRMRIARHSYRRLGVLDVYERAEGALVRYAERLGYSLKYLDEAIWVVMRVNARTSL